MLKTASLTPQQAKVILNKATEAPFSGQYTDENSSGSYFCRNCGLELFRSEHKFHSGCGWASFDDEVSGNIRNTPDSDGRRSEILCNYCSAHLGHIFYGEKFTAKNARYCVNSLALDFATDKSCCQNEEIILAAGCFWGVEYFLQKLPGVLLTEVGYCGGNVANPSYQDVCSKTSGHLEVVRVLYDPQQLSLDFLLKYFFEIHDPCQTDGQGPDLGAQYLSAIFCYTDAQKKIAQEVIELLRMRGYSVATQIREMAVFWRAEDYHQDYYNHKGSLPYCHGYQKKF
jgi:peptide methionine sulfoxide reductase msrA/msrB